MSTTRTVAWPGSRVVIVGAGIAGLLAARALADYFGEVLLLDRDVPAETPTPRKGAPQGRHFHGLLPGGLEVMSALFPALQRELVAAGARQVGARDFRYFSAAGLSYAQGFQLSEPSEAWRGSGTFVQTRDLLEGTLRRLVHAIDNVRPRYGASVRELCIEHGEIRGVLLETSDEVIAADFVIDATGRASATQRWLKSLGFAQPVESVINCALGYTSMLLEPTDPADLEGLGLFVAPDTRGVHRTRGAVLVQVERGRWLATLIGWAADYPPSELDAFHEFAKSLTTPLFHELVRSARPLSEPVSFRFPKSVRRHFERLQRFPARLLPLGDTLCFFNPVYGQGMSVAARQTAALLDLMKRRAASGADGLTDCAREFFQRANEEIRGPWLYAAMSDLMNQCTGDFPADESPSLDALQRLMPRAEAGDAAAIAQLSDLQSLRKPLASLLSGQETIIEKPQGIHEGRPW